MTGKNTQIEDPRNSSVSSDSELVTQALSNPEDFSMIMQKYSAKISRYICRIISLSGDEVEDLLQNVFIKTYKNLNDFDSSLSFSSWIYRIAHNEAIDYIRKNKRNKKSNSSEDDEDALLDIADDVNVSEEVHKKHIRKNINKILDSMREEYRTVLILKFLEERDYNEISDILKKPPGTVATLIHRAKEEFRKKTGKDLNIKDI
ncbi:MAG: RNA polymerase sigma factor [bacterium]|nr:RNA polymerase sigma factor [bacterium]